MYKFMSWLVIAFIGLVPLGAFFDTKQSPKPNMEKSFIKRQKRATNPSNGEIYEFSLSKATVNWMWDGFRQNFSIALSEFNKNESGLSKLPIEFKNTLTMKNSYIYLDEEGISTLKTGNFARSGNLEVVDIKGKIIKTHSFYNWLELMFTSPPLLEKDNEQTLPNQLKN